MKFLALSLVVVWQLYGSAAQGFCQEQKTGEGRLHFSVPFSGSFKGRFEFTASSAQRITPGGATGSILQLRGNVEVRTTVCRPTGDICDTSPFVLQSDAIDYNEATGEIQAQGAVRTSLAEPTPDSKFTANR